MIKRKILSLVLSGILTFGICSPVSATELPENPTASVTVDETVDEVATDTDAENIQQEDETISEEAATPIEEAEIPTLTYGSSILLTNLKKQTISYSLFYNDKVKTGYWFKVSVPTNTAYTMYSEYAGDTTGSIPFSELNVTGFYRYEGAKTYYSQYPQSPPAYYEQNYQGVVDFLGGENEYYYCIESTDVLPTLQFSLQTQPDLKDFADQAQEITEADIAAKTFTIAKNYKIGQYKSWDKLYSSYGILMKVTVPASTNYVFSIDNNEHSFLVYDANWEKCDLRDDLIEDRRTIMIPNDQSSAQMYYIWIDAASCSPDSGTMEASMTKVEKMSSLLPSATELNKDISTIYQYNAEDSTYKDEVYVDLTAAKHAKLYVVDAPGVYTVKFSADQAEWNAKAYVLTYKGELSNEVSLGADASDRFDIYLSCEDKYYILISTEDADIDKKITITLSDIENDRRLLLHEDEATELQKTTTRLERKENIYYAEGYANSHLCYIRFSGQLYHYTIAPYTRFTLNTPETGYVQLEALIKTEDGYDYVGLDSMSYDNNTAEDIQLYIIAVMDSNITIEETSLPVFTKELNDGFYPVQIDDAKEIKLSDLKKKGFNLKNLDKTSIQNATLDEDAGVIYIKDAGKCVQYQYLVDGIYETLYFAPYQYSEDGELVNEGWLEYYSENDEAYTGKLSKQIKVAGEDDICNRRTERNIPLSDGGTFIIAEYYYDEGDFYDIQYNLTPQSSQDLQQAVTIVAQYYKDNYDAISATVGRPFVDCTSDSLNVSAETIKILNENGFVLSIYLKNGTSYFLGADKSVSGAYVTDLNMENDVFYDLTLYEQYNKLSQFLNKDANNCLVSFMQKGRFPENTFYYCYNESLFDAGSTVYYYHFDQNAMKMELCGEYTFEDDPEDCYEIEMCPTVGGDYLITDKKLTRTEFPVEPEVKKPATVKNVKAAPTGKNKVKITWNQVSDADGYLIYAKKNGTYAYCGLVTSKTKTYYTDTKAQDIDYNFYWVYAYKFDANNKRVVGACEHYAYAKGTCLRVGNLKATSLKGGVKISWSKSAGADGYIIYGKTKSGKYGYIGMTSKTTYTHTKASKSEYNFYWVFPYHNSTSGKRAIGPISAKYVYGKAK